MFVNQSMTHEIITIRPDADVRDAHQKMAANRIRHLPVVDAHDRLLGIISDRDIRSALPPDYFRGPDPQPAPEKSAALQVRQVMTADPVTITPADTIQDALLLLQKMKVGALPVVDDGGKVKGIISVRDLMRAFINVLGIGEPGTLLCILVEEKIGQMKKIVDAITEEGVSFGSILVARYFDTDKRAVFPYLLTQDVRRVRRKLEKLGFTLLDPLAWYLDQLPGNA